MRRSISSPSFVSLFNFDLTFWAHHLPGAHRIFGTTALLALSIKPSTSLPAIDCPFPSSSPRFELTFDENCNSKLKLCRLHFACPSFRMDWFGILLLSPADPLYFAPREKTNKRNSRSVGRVDPFSTRPIEISLTAFFFFSFPFLFLLASICSPLATFRLQK